MKEKQNEFYSSISKYYHEIFPFNPAQLKFVERNTVGLIGKKILDIGCATGELSFQLANAGAEVTGIDLNKDLLNRAKSEKKHPSVTFQEGDMLELKTDFNSRQFDAVLCFGNTLVHLPSTRQVEQMLHGVRSVLKSGGIFLLQILNYDYIVTEKVSELPIIDTESVKFLRRYIIEENNPLIRFHTRLYLKKEEEVIENETQLLALKSNDLSMLFKKVGFTTVDFFSNFNEEKIKGNHLPLVAKSS